MTYEGVCSVKSSKDMSQKNVGKTPLHLHLVLQMGRVVVARMLFRRGMDLTAQNNDG